MTIEDFNIKTKVEVEWGEMDAFQHVNNVVYVRWGENARIDYLDALGCLSTVNSPFLPILGFQSVKYIRQVKYPDTILIGSRTEEIREDRFILKSYYFSEKQQSLVAIKTHEIVMIDGKTHQKIALPEIVIENIKAIDKRS